MKKICHMSSAHHGLDIRIFRKECVSLAAAGFDTHLVINAAAADVSEAAGYGVTLHPLTYVPESRRFSRMSVHAWRCYSAAKKLDADIYHFHDPELMPYGLMLARAGKQVIFDAHEDLPGEIHSKDWVPLPARWILASAARWLQNFGVARLAAVVAATPFIGSLFDGIAKRVVVINNFPLIGELSPQSEDETNPRDSVCYVGGIDEIRGIREVVQAIGRTQSRLLLAGKFAKDAVRNEVMRYVGWSRVKEYGFVDRQKISEIMARSFSGLVTLHHVPNFVNSQPIKMFEYMSAGVPVIASNFPLWREVIEGNECGICVDQNDPEAIAAAIRHFHERPEEVARMGKNGRLAVESKYRWDCEEKKLVALYRDLLGY
ncbi:Glycosyltransferase involved in cell wall bisynthesis [Noviherbaspirillum humi]|uniref:Glycosyltransferase involved in cell wall bisynthesis n=1 Tax=Noviherbaspirillum humi TaxID=1688639 RepID=A0A239GAB9_9BURK|nr:glycosyltransferase [Noviherbaspirillum humi]SNS65662.1 Glycosyltransferase involved in cell wall bisynthesis [Noviherbaspirillum humi]